MKKTSNQIVFFGSGPVAAKSLELLATVFSIEAVVTKPRPPHHKGDVPVLRVASDLDLPVHTVTNKQSLDTLIKSQPFKSELGILIDFGIIVSQQVIEYFPLGIINSHFSLLPEWRGADPITFAVLSGQKETGVSLMLLTAGMDEGPLLAQTPCSITKDTTTPSLTDELIILSHNALQHIAPLYIEGKIEAIPQEFATLASTSVPTYSRKLTKADGHIDWTKSATEVEREIRAFIEWPRSQTTLAGKQVIITKASVTTHEGQPGSCTLIDKQLVAFCGQGSLIIERLQPAGKKEMTGQAFAAGHKALLTSS